MGHQLCSGVWALHVGQAQLARETCHALGPTMSPTPQGTRAGWFPVQVIPPSPHAQTHRTTVSATHQRSGEVWRMLIVLSASEPDSQVVQPLGQAGKEAQAQDPAPNPTQPNPPFWGIGVAYPNV